MNVRFNLVKKLLNEATKTNRENRTLVLIIKLSHEISVHVKN